MTKTLFLNRDLSWLSFNERVLNEALDPRTPLLERVRFLSIAHSNLDEFFMKRVGGIKRQIAAGVTQTSTGESPDALLARIRSRVLELLLRQAEGFERGIRPSLERAGILLPGWSALSEQERDALTRQFMAEIFPVLTPLAVDPGHPFPFISNLSTSLGVTLRRPDQDEILFARVKVPRNLPQWLPLPGPGPLRLVSLQEVIERHLHELFPGMRLLSVMPFRVTRNADIERDEEDAEDLLEMIEEELRQRRFAKVVRIEHGPDPDPWMVEFLRNELELEDHDLYEMPSLLDFTSLRSVADLPMPEHKHRSFVPAVPERLSDPETSIFSAIRERDLLVHHPYESFHATVERFIREAAVDPAVRAIKMTLYRTSEDSPFIPMLIRAAEEGKHVVCLIEVKARFDEERNISLAQALERAGVHVVYGVVGLKTHAKLSLVVRQDADRLRSYCHIGTGNYHSQTARLYTDLGLLTCDPQITADVVDLFHYLTGRSLLTEFRRLLVAPLNMKERFLALIEREAAHARAGRPARIVAKMNSLEDAVICRALYAASGSGVKIDLIVRGFCCLRPGLPGLSERIRVISVIGRFLEHSRIFYFRNGATDPSEGEFFLGSADWMYRNLLARVEAVTPVLDPVARARCWELLTRLLEDKRQAWDMDADGRYAQRKPVTAREELGVHERFLTQS